MRPVEVIALALATSLFTLALQQLAFAADEPVVRTPRLEVVDANGAVVAVLGSPAVGVGELHVGTSESPGLTLTAGADGARIVGRNGEHGFALRADANGSMIEVTRTGVDGVVSAVRMSEVGGQVDLSADAADGTRTTLMPR